jgi:hypothetical protein
MYVDKPMKGHHLMQAIARVNRVFKDKLGGLVVDCIGIANELEAALKDYTQGKGKPTIAAGDALAVLLEKMDVLHDMLHGFDYTAFRTHPGLAAAALAWRTLCWARKTARSSATSRRNMHCGRSSARRWSAPRWSTSSRPGG